MGFRHPHMFVNVPPANLDVTATLKALEAKAVSPYDISIIALAHGELGNKGSCELAIVRLKSALEKLPNNPNKTWMLARAENAYKNIGLPGSLKEIVAILKNCKLEECEKDKQDDFLAELAWTYGYLAFIDYKTYKDLMLEATKIVPKKADALWACVMNVRAAARAGDDVTYKQILEDMLAISGKSTIAEAIAEIPANDWRAWALGIVQFAAVTITDMSLVTELVEPLQKSINEAVRNNSLANALMAQIKSDQVKARLELKNVEGIRARL